MVRLLAMNILDLYCGAGGASAGYVQAGHTVTGVDLHPQPDYPYKFIQGDALAYVAEHGHEYDAIHASPPCQASTTLAKGTLAYLGKEYPQLIPATRAALAQHHGPTFLENVVGADMRADLTLCGEMFGLRVIRHRRFEINGATVPVPNHIPHRGKVLGHNHYAYTSESDGGYYFPVYGHGGGKGSLAMWQDAMRINWTNNRRSITEAIPPAYTRYIGSHL